MMHTIVIDEMQRQIVLLALARCSIAYPGWELALSVIAKAIPGGVEMYQQFRAINAQALNKTAETINRALLSNVAETCAKIIETGISHDQTVANDALKAVAEEVRRYASDLKG